MMFETQATKYIPMVFLQRPLPVAIAWLLSGCPGGESTATVDPATMDPGIPTSGGGSTDGTSGTATATGSSTGEVGTDGESSTAAPASCHDAAHNGDETDVDCGGICPACPDGGVCGGDDDCASMLCADGTCAAPVCDDDGDCAVLSETCAAGSCVRGACVAVPVEDGIPCDDQQVCTVGPAACSAGICVDSEGTAGTIQLDDVATGIGGYVVDSFQYTGSRVTMLSDFNGDGFADIALSEPSYNEGTKGRVWFMLGKVDGEPMSFSDLQSKERGFYLDGMSNSHYLGLALRSGDINNDGKGDLVIGSGFLDTYRIRVIYGQEDHMSISLNSADVRLKNPNADNSLGVQIAVADVNNDGFDDIVSADTAFDLPGKTNAGRTYVIFGGQVSDVDLTAITSGSGGFVIDGAKAGELAGGYLSAAGDVNASGTVQSVYVVFGGDCDP